MLLKIKDNQVIYPYTWEKLEQDNPGVSIGRTQSEDSLAELGIFTVRPTTPPSYNPSSEQLSEDSPRNEGGQWIQQWIVNRLDRTLAENNLREKRNQMLRNSDWTQLVDSPVNKQAWIQYRNELRDITNQPGFPFSVVWPQEPNE